MPIFSPVFKPGLHVSNPVSHLFLRGEINSNTQVNLNWLDFGL